MIVRSLSDVIAFSPEQASKMTVAEGDHCRVTVWCLEPGQEIRPHVHAGDHVWVVQQGAGWFLSQGQEHRVSPGVIVFAPAGEVHGMRAEGQLVFTSVTAG